MILDSIFEYLKILLVCFEFEPETEPWNEKSLLLDGSRSRSGSYIEKQHESLPTIHEKDSNIIYKTGFLTGGKVDSNTKTAATVLSSIKLLGDSKHQILENSFYDCAFERNLWSKYLMNVIYTKNTEVNNIKSKELKGNGDSNPLLKLIMVWFLLILNHGPLEEVLSSDTVECFNSYKFPLYDLSSAIDEEISMIIEFLETGGAKNDDDAYNNLKVRGLAEFIANEQSNFDKMHHHHRNDVCYKVKIANVSEIVNKLKAQNCKLTIDNNSGSQDNLQSNLFDFKIGGSYHFGEQINGYGGGAGGGFDAKIGNCKVSAGGDFGGGVGDGSIGGGGGSGIKVKGKLANEKIQLNLGGGGGGGADNHSFGGGFGGGGHIRIGNISYRGGGGCGGGIDENGPDFGGNYEGFWDSQCGNSANSKN